MGGSRESWRSNISCREVWMGQGRVGGQSYPVGKCGWVKGELEVKAILQGSVDGSMESWRSKLSCREVWVGQGRVGGQTYPVGKYGWVKGELEVNSIL